VTDLLGTVELLTDGSGSIVERITYDPEGRPQFWSADTQRPRVTRVAWTGDGRDGRCPAGIPLVSCPPWAFQLAFGEELDAASAGEATASLTPEGGSPQALALSLTPEARAAYLTGAALQAGIRYSLHLEGLRDRAGNLLWPLELTFTLTDPTVFQVLEDTAPPRLLAALDAADGLYLAWEEPVEVASGFTLDTSIAVLRQGQLVQGTVSQLSPQLFRWKPVEESQWLPGGEYTLSAVHLQDLSGKAATAPSLSFTHMAASPQVAYLVYQAPGDSQPQARSAYGLTTFFQGRTWHEELGLYHYRARWYSPELGDFLERDPLGYLDSPNLYQFVNRNPVNFVDPLGLYEKDIHFYAVYYLARKAGFAREQAEQIAWASQRVDEKVPGHESTCPDLGCLWQRHYVWVPGYLNDEALKAYHFVSPNGSAEVVTENNPEVQRVVSQARQSGDLMRLGIAMHTLADSYSHAGFVGYSSDVNDTPVTSPRPDIGHGDAGHEPDWPYVDPPKALRALEAMYRALFEAAGGRGEDWYSVLHELQSYVPWPLSFSTVPAILSLHDEEPGRSELWKKLIETRLGEKVTFETVDKPRGHKWQKAFDQAARAQRKLVLGGQ
jgi:RHS repeat-associated protein